MNHDVVYTTDRRGRRVALVKLTNSDARATMLAEDFDRIVALDVRALFANKSGQGVVYVRCQPRGADQPLMLSRLLLGAGAGEVVRHRNGNRLDFRPSNLSVEPVGRRIIGREERWLEARDTGNEQPRRAALTRPPRATAS